MWKFVARGIRESLERRSNCRTNLCSQSSQEGNAKGETKTSLACNQKFLAPSFSAFTNEFCGSARSRGAKDEKQESKWDAKHNWTEAVGWSSVLALGWVVSQSLCLRRRFFEKDQHQETAFHKKVLHLPEVHIKHLLAQVLSLKPQFVIPTAHCISNNVGKVDVATETDWTPSKPYGPLTAEETWKEAGNEFAHTNRVAMGELELRLGILAIKDKRYNDALKNFATGAKLFSPGSMFNLGLCHELGFGTKVDDRKAARYYREAAEMGHANAMYNLAVFYAQGRGDFSIDTDRARTLFKRAADLGQENAKKALTAEAKYQAELIAEETQAILSKKKKSSLKKGHDFIRNNILSHMAKYESTSSKKSDSYFNEPRIEDTENSTQAFLNLLGIKEQTVQPIANSC